MFSIFRKCPNGLTLKCLGRIITLLLVLVPAMLLFGLSYLVLGERENHITNELEKTVTIQQQSINLWFNNRAALVHSLAQVEGVKNQKPEAMQGIFDLFLRENKDISNISFVNKDGVVVTSTDSVGVGLNFSDREYFNRAIKGEDYVTDVIPGRKDGTPIIVFSAPVINGNNQFQGAVIAAVKIEEINSMLEKWQLGKTGDIYLVNRDGMVINSINKATQRQQLINSNEGFIRSLSGDFSSSTYINHDGEKVFGSIKKINNPAEWLVIAEINKEEITYRFFSYWGMLFLLYLIMLGLTISVHIYVTKRIRTPVYNLMMASKEIQQGNYVFQIDEKYINNAPEELRQLCITFNQMTKTIDTNVRLLEKTNQSLTEAENKYRILVENSLAGVYMVVDELIMYANPQAAEIFGYTVGEVINKPYTELIASDDLDYVLGLRKEMLRGRASVGAQFKGVTKDKRVIDLEIYTGAYSYEGKFVMLGTIIDITARKQMEQKLKEAHRDLELKVQERTAEILHANRLLKSEIKERQLAEEKMLAAKEEVARSEQLASLGAMAAGIAHEINQPLNSIKVTADSILYWYKRGQVLDTNEVLTEITSISNQAGRIDKIITNMRSLVKSSNQIQKENCNLNYIANLAVKALEDELLVKGIKIEANLQQELPDIKGVPSQLEEVIFNLLANSMQALEVANKSHKKICVKTWQQDQVYIEICDNGDGIKEEIKAKIFQPFFTTKEDNKNMGLGLSIIHTIVAAHGAKVEVSNNEEGGASFVLAFPQLSSEQKGEAVIDEHTPS